MFIYFSSDLFFLTDLWNDLNQIIDSQENITLSFNRNLCLLEPYNRSLVKYKVFPMILLSFTYLLHQVDFSKKNYRCQTKNQHIWIVVLNYP